MKSLGAEAGNWLLGVGEAVSSIFSKSKKPPEEEVVKPEIRSRNFHDGSIFDRYGLSTNAPPPRTKAQIEADEANSLG